MDVECPVPLNPWRRTTLNLKLWKTSEIVLIASMIMRAASYGPLIKASPRPNRSIRRQILTKSRPLVEFPSSPSTDKEKEVGKPTGHGLQHRGMDRRSMLFAGVLLLTRVHATVPPAALNQPRLWLPCVRPFFGAAPCSLGHGGRTHRGQLVRFVFRLESAERHGQVRALGVGLREVR